MRVRPWMEEPLEEDGSPVHGRREGALAAHLVLPGRRQCPWFIDREDSPPSPRHCQAGSALPACPNSALLRPELCLHTCFSRLKLLPQALGGRVCLRPSPLYLGFLPSHFCQTLCPPSLTCSPLHPDYLCAGAPSHLTTSPPEQGRDPF